MCGIFGVVLGAHSSVTAPELRALVDALFRLSESRGREAAGLALVSGDVIRVHKQATSATEMLRTAEYDAVYEGRTRAVIGHSRLVTNGSQALEANNQPVIAGDLVGVHNGIVVNVDALWE